MTLGLATWILAVLLQRQRAQAEQVQRAQIEALDAANDELQRVSADRALLVREVHHRVKNNLGMIESILHLTALDADDESRALLDDVGARIEAIRGVHDALYRSEEVTRAVGLERYLPRLVEQLTRSLCPFPVQVRSEITPVSITARSAIAVGIIAAEVTTNAIKYGLEPNTELTISAHRDGPMLRLAFSNTGRPYRPAAEPGLGTELMHQLSAQLGGSVNIDAGERTTVVLEFPFSGCLEEEQGFRGAIDTGL
jgi:two-component sensor histidine kinase